MKTTALLAVLLPFTTAAQSGKMAYASPYTDFGAYTHNVTELPSFRTNQAALANLKHNGFALYSERKYMLTELSSYSAVASVTTSSGNFGLAASYYGGIEYNESQLGLAYARKLGEKLKAGLQFNYNSIHISTGYGKASAISAEAGILFHITDKLNSGVQVRNPVAIKFGSNKEEALPRAYAAGIGYTISDKVLVNTELIKEDRQPATFNAGIQYKPVSAIQVRLGISTAAPTAWFGVGFLLKSFRLDAFTSIHPHLGITPGIMLQYSAKRNKK